MGNSEEKTAGFPEPDARELTPQYLTRVLDSLPHWRARDFNESEWQRFLHAARIFQLAKDEDIIAALNGYLALRPEERSSDQDPNWMAFDPEVWSKPYLLFRVMFALPEVPVIPRRPPAGWQTEPSDGPFSPSWPITWVAGKPCLVAMLTGYEGAPYSPAAEYRYYRQNVPFRSLAPQ